MKKLIRMAVILIVVASFLALPTPVSAADYDWGGGDWTISSDTAIWGVQYNIGTFTIELGWTATVDGANGGMVEIHAQTVNIYGTLTATGQGYGTDAGTAPGTAGATKNGGGGGGYGGIGGNGDTGALGGQPAYGSDLAPIDLGSGGGASGTEIGGSGGGAIIIHCSGTVTIDGTVEANGNPGLGGGNDAGGGGSGGSIYITTDVIGGTGSITANGGDGNSTKYFGGGGGGGRIAVHYSSGTVPTTSVAGGSATPDATAGATGSNTTGTTFWRTYKDSGYSDAEDVFNDYATEHTVYIKGTGLPNGGIDYTIVLWDTAGLNAQTDTPQAGPDITSLRILSVSRPDPAGTWYASVYEGTTPGAHTGTSGETANLKADYAFLVEAAAIPEFPTVITAVAVAGLCFGIYYWMRKRYRRAEVRIQGQ